MRRIEERQTTVRVVVSEVCDGCGIEADPGYELVAVVISVHEGEEGGRRDEYDYCDDCLVARAPALVAAGSRAPLVTGNDEPVEAGS